MSGCSDAEEISDADRHGYREGGSDGDDDDSEIGKMQQRKRRMGSGFGKGMGKVFVHQFTKAKKQIRRIRSRKTLLQESRSGKEGKVLIGGDGSGRERERGRERGRGRGSGCKFCFSRPKVLESPNESPTSDPNDPSFTHAMLKTLLDKNDFYCKECNPHLS